MKKQIFVAIALFVIPFFASGKEKIRPYNSNRDYQQISALCSKIWRELAENNEHCSGSFDTILIALHQKLLGKTYTKVIEVDGHIVGFALAAAFVEDLDPVIPAEPNIAELSYFFLDPDYKGKAYGILLLQAIKQGLIKDGITALLTRVPLENDEAYNWHLAQGFAPIQAGQSKTPLEERERIAAQAHGYTLFRMGLETEVIRSIEPYESYLDLFAEEQKSVAQVEKTKAFLQTSIVEQHAQQAHHLFPSLTLTELVKIISRYYQFSFNKGATIKAALYILKKSTHNKEVKKVIQQIMRFVDNHREALESSFTQELQGTVIIA